MNKLWRIRKKKKQKFVWVTLAPRRVSTQVKISLKERNPILFFFNIFIVFFLQIRFYLEKHQNKRNYISNNNIQKEKEA